MNNSFTENPKQSVLFQNTTKGKGKQKGKDKQKGEEKQKEKEKEKEKEKQKKKGKCNVDDNGEPYQKCNEDQILQLTLLNKPTEFIGIQGNDHGLSNKFTNPNEFIDPNGSNDDDDDDDDDDCFDLGRSTNSLGRSSKQSMSNSNNITLQKKKQGEKEKDTKTKKNGDCFIIKKQKPKKNNDDEKVKTWMEMYSHEIEEIFQELDLDDGETNFAFNHLKIVFRYIDFNNVKKHFTRFDPIPKLIYLYTNHPHLYKIEHFFEQILYVYVYGVYEPDYHISYRIFQSLFGFDKSIMHRSVKAIQEGRPYQTRGKPKLLRTCEEEYLTERIHILAKLGISITVSECLYIANQIIHSWNLKEYHKVRKKIASTQWIYPFAKRNQLKIQRPTYLEEARLVVNESVVLNFFKLLHDLNATYKYDSHLIFNMDETSVQVKPSRKMVCLAPMNKKKNIYKGKAKNGRLISLAVTITARGKLLKTLVIIPNKCVSEKTFEKSDLEDFFWTYSKKGFMNKKIFLQWVNKIFIPTVIKIRKKQNLDENERALLILDGHSSRINFPALVLMRINCVDVVIIPSHSSHILQPLDVGVFHIFKSNLRKAKLNQDDNPFLTIDECLIQSTTKKKIIGAFKKCGLFPLDLSKVINHPGIFPTEVQKIYGRVNTGRRLHLGGKLISSKEMIKQMKEKFERQMKKKHKEVISSMYDELLDGLENSKGINKEQVQFLHMPNYLFDQPFDKRVLRGDDTDEQFEKFLENCEPSQKFVQSVHEINTTLTKSPNCELPTIPSNLNKKNGQNENINSNQNSDPIEKNSIGSDKNTNSINNNKQNDDITSNQNSILIEKNFGSNRNSNLTDTNKQNDDITSNQNSDPMEKNSIGSDRNLNLLNDNQPNMDFSILNNSPLILKQKHQKTKSKKKGQNSQKIVKKKLIHTFNQQTLFQTPRKRQKSDEILSRLRIINEYEDDISNVIMDKENIDPITKNKKPNFTKNNRGRGKGRRKRYNKNYKNVEKKDQNKKNNQKRKKNKRKNGGNYICYQNIRTPKETPISKRTRRRRYNRSNKKNKN